MYTWFSLDNNISKFQYLNGYKITNSIFEQENSN